jgi:hypothetical protein
VVTMDIFRISMGIFGKSGTIHHGKSKSNIESLNPAKGIFFTNGLRSF